MKSQMKSQIPPCQAACPIHQDVCGYVSAIARGDLEEAIRIIREVNPFPSVCGRICTMPCEAACRRAQVDEPISIAALKRFASDHTKRPRRIERPQCFSDERVAIIGGGPAGLTAAHDLALFGYRVTLFESQNVLGGMLTEGIPDYRLPKDVVKEEIDFILSLGIEAKTNKALSRDFTIEELLKDYQAIFLAIGSQKSLLPRCNGVELTGIITAVEFLKQVGRGERPFLGKSVVVVGGGHTAIDAARTSLRLGSPQVTIIYRRTSDEMPAGRREVEEAEEEGVKIRYLTAPVEFVCEGNAKRVRCIGMRLGEPDESGRPRPILVEDSGFEIEADTVILAIGYIPEAEPLKKNGLILGKGGTVVVNDDTGATNIRGVFSGGDVVSGPSSAVEAIASGKKAARAIHRYLRHLPDEVEEYSIFGSLNESIVKLINKSGREEMPALSIEERIDSFAEVELGYNREEALMEAQRCLNCGAGAFVGKNCAACLHCVRICPYGVPAPGKGITEIDISQCQACGICASECPASAIDVRLETREEARAILENVIDMARQETRGILMIGFYCQYRLPAGPPSAGDGVYPVRKKAPAETRSKLQRGELSNGVYWLGKLCTGRLDVFQLIYPFELCADGVVIHMCPYEECHFKDGGRWLLRRIEKAREILNEIGIGSDRLDVIFDGGDLLNFRKRLETIGMNPLRKAEG
ncbi:MAG: NADPH-Fe(3+) oxidoreductase subunit beta [Actinobacteria bacterium]|nr:NADPH-Fe(3+) oxidoreductase subunit beta [Actinomycetota bacterium]